MLRPVYNARQKDAVESHMGMTGLFPGIVLKFKGYVFNVFLQFPFTTEDFISEEIFALLQ